MRYFIGFLFLLALAAVACSETSGTVGGGGAAGVGGAAGSGIGGGGGSSASICLPAEDRCTTGLIEPHRACCEPGVPDQADACDGTESLVNPATCTPTGTGVVYELTMMEAEEDCNVGYDLDGCDGETCVRGELAPGEGLDGVDNGLAELGRVLAAVDAPVRRLNQALSDRICGMTDSHLAGVCESGENEGLPCRTLSDCPGSRWGCTVADDDCLGEVPLLELRLVVDANVPEGCANVDLLVGANATSHVLNLSDDGCLSGALGTTPFETAGLFGAFHGTVVRMTISEAGFSHGLFGGIMDRLLAGEISSIWLPGSADVFGSPLDIPVSTTAAPDEPAECDGMSAAFRIGGVVEDAPNL